MLKEKGFAPLIITLGIVVILGIVGGIYYLGKVNSKPQIQNPAVTSKSTFQDTTKGLEISLPDNLVVCEYASDLKLKQAASCSLEEDSGDGSILIDTYNQFHHPMFGPVIPKTSQESLHDWVIEIANGISTNNNQLNKTNREHGNLIIIEQIDDISDIDSNTVLDRVTNKITESNKASYAYYTTIYQQQGDNIIALSLRSNIKGENIDKLKSLLPLIRSIPITTGDLGLNITWHHNKNSGSYVDYTGYLYQADQKTIAANIKPDWKGLYFVKLKPGTYYFFYPDGSSKQLQVKLGINNSVPFTKNNIIDIATEKDMFNGPVPNSPPK